MSDELADAITHYVYYGVRQRNGLTRREYLENAEQPVPEMYLPENFEYIWEWFFDLAQNVDRAGDGYTKPIPFDAYDVWERKTGNIVRPFEYDILRAMDHAFCLAMTKEIQAQRAAAQAEAEQQAKRR